MRNDPSDPYQRVTIVEPGESLHTRAQLVACVHGALSGGDGYATFLAINFTFMPVYNNRRYRRARQAKISLLFTSEGVAPEVVDIRPKGILRNTAVNIVESSIEGASIVAGLGGGLEVTWEKRRETVGHITTQGTIAPLNGARWIVQENEQRKTGIPSSLTCVLLLRRTDQNIFSMVPKVDVKLNGLSLEEALTPRLPVVDPVIFNPTFGSMIVRANLPSHLTNIDQNNLEDFWQSQVLGTDDCVFISQAASSTTGTSRVTRHESIAQASERFTSHGAAGASERDSSRFKISIARGIYTDLWNIDDADPATTRRLRDQWKDLGGCLDENKLSEHFSWLKDELQLQDISNVELEGEQPDLRTYTTENARPETQRRPVEIPETTHTLCSVLVRKARSQRSFKSFQDLGRQLFDEQTIDSVAEFFSMDTTDYNGFRKLDFGSCEILSTGEGNELSTFYIIQTPYYSSGFWSMFLVGKADPKNPDQARKLSGLIQGGADVDLEGILDRTASEAERFSYHPLLLPYHLYVDHYENTSKQFDIVLKKVELAELRIMDALQNRKDSAYGATGAAHDDTSIDVEPNHWGLANLGKSLHEASMEIAEVARRRQFEDSLAGALKTELGQRRSAQNQMFRDLSRYHRWANAHQLDIEGMPGRIDSLKNLLYSMIAQQDNVVSIKLAREGLSDSKAMKTLSIMTILFLPGTFVATLFTTDVVSFENSAAEVRAYINVVTPLTAGLMILYVVWLWKAPAWSRSRRKMRDPEAGSLKMFHTGMHKTSYPPGKEGKQS